MVVNDMEQIIVGIIILLVIVGIIFFIVVRKQFSSNNENINVNITPLEDNKVSNYNQSDINMLNSLNDNVITNKPKNSKIVIPDFDKSKPIGYKDLSHINNTYGDRVAQSNNQNNK